jgi:anti-sigma factor RsiW
MSASLSMWRRMRGSAEVASCREVGQVLQSYLDSELDELAAHRIARHLELCRRCGMEASTYAGIKASLARNGAHAAHQDAVIRLREFGQRLVDDPPQE